MKLVDGGSLADRLAAYRDDPQAAAALLAEVAEAVHHAHQRGHPPPRPEAGQHPARRRRASRTSPTSAWPSGSRPTPS